MNSLQSTPHAVSVCLKPEKPNVAVPVCAPTLWECLFLVSLSPQSHRTELRGRSVALDPESHWTHELDHGRCPLTTPLSVFTNAANTGCCWSILLSGVMGRSPQSPQRLLSCVSREHLILVSHLCEFICLVLTGSHSLAQASLRPTLALNSQEFSCLSLPSAGTAGRSYSARLVVFSGRIPYPAVQHHPLPQSPAPNCTERFTHLTGFFAWPLHPACEH